MRKDDKEGREGKSKASLSYLELEGHDDVSLFITVFKNVIFPDTTFVPLGVRIPHPSVHDDKIPVAFSTATVRRSLEIDDIVMARSTFSYLVFTVVPPAAVFPPLGQWPMLG